MALLGLDFKQADISPKNTIISSKELITFLAGKLELGEIEILKEYNGESAKMKERLTNQLLFVQGLTLADGAFEDLQQAARDAKLTPPPPSTARSEV